LGVTQAADHVVMIASAFYVGAMGRVVSLTNRLKYDPAHGHAALWALLAVRQSEKRRSWSIQLYVYKASASRL